MTVLLRDVRPFGGAATDVLIRDGRIADATASTDGSASVDCEVIDGAGQILLPGFVDAHAHVDKTTWGTPYRPHTAEGTLASLTENERRYRGTLGASVEERAGALLDEYIRHGTTMIRTHVDVDTDAGLSSVEGVLAAAAARADRLDVEVVAFPQSGMLVRPGTDVLVERAAAAGTLVGGIDPAGFDSDPIRHLDTIFAIAERHGRGMDIHLHDRGTLGAWEIGLIADRTRALGMAGRVTISHAFALSTVDAARQGQLIEVLADADIAVTTIAPGTTPALPLRELRAAGVRVGVGQDGIRDLWSPYGDADMLERARLLAYTNGFRRDEDIELAVRAATTGGAAVVGRSDYGLSVGDRADLVLVPGETLAHAVVSRPARTLVMKAGRRLA